MMVIPALPASKYMILPVLGRSFLAVRWDAASAHWATRWQKFKSHNYIYRQCNIGLSYDGLMTAIRQTCHFSNWWCLSGGSGHFLFWSWKAFRMTDKDGKYLVTLLSGVSNWNIYLPASPHPPNNPNTALCTTRGKILYVY